MDLPSVARFNALPPRTRFKTAHRLARLACKDNALYNEVGVKLGFGMVTHSVWVKNAINGKFRPIYGYNNGYKLRLGLVVAGIRPLKDGEILGYPISAYFNKYVY